MLTVHRKWTSCILEDGSESKLCGVYVLSSSYYCRTERERLRRSVRSSAIDMDWGFCVAFTGTMESKYPRGICSRQLCTTWIPHGYPSYSTARSLLDVRGRDGSHSAIYVSWRSRCVFLTENLSWNLRYTSPYVQIRKSVSSLFRLTWHY